jgi:putative transposase
MSNYTRFRVPGGTYFFALRLQDRRSNLLVERIDLLRMAMRVTKDRKPFVLRDVAALPAQLMMIVTLPEGDADYSNRWGMMKAVFSRHVPAPADLSDRQLRRGEKGIWQRRFWEHVIRDETDYQWHRAHVLSAPVREGLVARPEMWPHSSIHRDGGLCQGQALYGGVLTAAE